MLLSKQIAPRPPSPPVRKMACFVYFYRLFSTRPPPSSVHFAIASPPMVRLVISCQYLLFLFVLAASMLEDCMFPNPRSQLTLPSSPFPGRLKETVFSSATQSSRLPVPLALSFLNHPSPLGHRLPLGISPSIKIRPPFQLGSITYFQMSPFHFPPALCPRPSPLHK